MKFVTHYFEVARAREAIRRLRASGAPPPWSTDPIFTTWRFCNVDREDDKVTAWFRTHVRDRLDDSPHTIQAVLAFRWFNRIEVGERIQDLLIGTWNRKTARRRLAGITPVTNAAYMVNTPAGFGKLDGVLECIDLVAPHLIRLWQNWTRPTPLEEAWRTLQTLPRVGSFVAYEAVTDLRHTPVLRDAPDIMTWAAAGPGCARGLDLIVGDGRRFNYTARRHQGEMLTLMQELLAMSRDPAHWPYVDKPWEMRTVEHVLCEYAKFRNAAAGRRLKRRFTCT